MTWWCHMVTYIWVNIGSSNSLLPDGTKPLPEPMLTKHQWGPATYKKNRTLLDNQVNTVAADAQASCQVFNIQDKGTLAFISLWGRISTTCTYVLSVERWWIYKQTYFHFSLKNSEAEPNTYLPHRTQWATSLEIRPVPATGWLPLVFDFQGNDYLWLRLGPLLVVPHT